MTDAFHDLWLLDPVPGFCCQDDYISRSRPVRLHTGGCPNRCRTAVVVPFARWRGLVPAYPCPMTAGHDGDHSLHPAYRVAAIDPERVLAALDQAGFVRAGHRTGQYVRFKWPDATGPRDPSLIVPLSPEFADYEDLLAGTLHTLDRAVRAGDTARTVLGALGAPVTESHIRRLIDASSLGTPDARRLRDSVPDETARRIVERSEEIPADGSDIDTPDTPHPRSTGVSSNT